ncbi:hypothetical protein [Streptomyces sp. NPDC058486]|uniref:hypothetical protein n=1 Tax=unclassified Streptomyces TaxID=2593676 RepID=UPI0036491BCB
MSELADADPVPAPAPAPAAVPAAPLHTRETASPGYHRELAAHQEVASPSQVDLAVAIALAL